MTQIPNLRNRNRLVTIENRLAVANGGMGEWRREGLRVWDQQI